MRRLAQVALALLMGSVASAATDPQVVAPIQKFIDSFNKGDVAAAAATHSATEDLVIIDEVAPFVWHGAQAFQAWVADLASNDKKAGITDQAVAVSAPTRIETTGDQAYVIVPTVYTFKEHGVAKRAAAQMTVVLKKGASGWLIHGWTWTGPKPKTAAPAKP
jgi:ketosteroid isomerase-like protein